jgi:hypothetical protein
MTDGWKMTFIDAQTTKERQSPFLRLKMVTA